MVNLPIGVDAHLSASYTPRLYPALPPHPLPDADTCTAVDPALGRCQMWATTHQYHRTRWADGAYEASWRNA